jgi:hypothetical protein
VRARESERENKKEGEKKERWTSIRGGERVCVCVSVREGERKRDRE